MVSLQLLLVFIGALAVVYALPGPDMALTERIHPANSRVQLLAEQTPAAPNTAAATAAPPAAPAPAPSVQDAPGPAPSPPQVATDAANPPPMPEATGRQALPGWVNPPPIR